MNFQQMRVVIEAVCLVTCVTEDILLSKEKFHTHKLARQLAFYTLRITFNWSYKEIATAFEYKGHRSVREACEDAFNRKAIDDILSMHIHKIHQVSLEKYRNHLGLNASDENVIVPETIQHYAQA
jgi:chromosomal replication initiation ATPase DnaA